MVKRGSKHRRQVALTKGQRVIVFLSAFACLTLASCSDSQGHSDWDLNSDVRDPASPVPSEGPCGQLATPTPDAHFQEISEGIWHRDFPAFQANCGAYQVSMTLDSTSKNPDEWSYRSQFRVCNRCGEKSQISWLKQTYEPPGEVTTQEVDSFGESDYRPIFILNDQQGNRYPIGCASLTIGTGAEYKWEVQQYEIEPGDVAESSFTGHLTDFFDSPLAIEQSSGESEYWSQPLDYSDELGTDIFWGAVVPSDATSEAVSVAGRLEAVCRETGYNVPSEQMNISMEQAFDSQSIETLGLPSGPKQYLESLDQSHSHEVVE